MVDESDTFTSKIKVYENEEYVIAYSNVKRSNDNHIILNDGGFIQNKEGFNGISKIKATFTGGSLKYCYGYSISNANEIELTSDVDYKDASKYSYFKLELIKAITLIGFINS